MKKISINAQKIFFVLLKLEKNQKNITIFTKKSGFIKRKKDN